MPTKLRELKAHAKKHGVTVDHHGGKHSQMLTKDGYRPYPLSVYSGGDDIDDSIVKKLCEHFDIPRPK